MSEKRRQQFRVLLYFSVPWLRLDRKTLKSGRDGVWRVQGEKQSKVNAGCAEERLISDLIVMADNMIPSEGRGEVNYVIGLPRGPRFISLVLRNASLNLNLTGSLRLKTSPHFVGFLTGLGRTSKSSHRFLSERRDKQFG